MAAEAKPIPIDITIKALEGELDELQRARRREITRHTHKRVELDGKIDNVLRQIKDAYDRKRDG